MIDETEIFSKLKLIYKMEENNTWMLWKLIARIWVTYAVYNEFIFEDDNFSTSFLESYVHDINNSKTEENHTK